MENRNLPGEWKLVIKKKKKIEEKPTAKPSSAGQWVSLPILRPDTSELTFSSSVTPSSHPHGRICPVGGCRGQLWFITYPHHSANAVMGCKRWNHISGAGPPSAVSKRGQGARWSREEGQAPSSSCPWLSAGEMVNRRRGDPRQDLFGEILFLQPGCGRERQDGCSQPLGTYSGESGSKSAVGGTWEAPGKQNRWPETSWSGMLLL